MENLAGFAGYTASPFKNSFLAYHFNVSFDFFSKKFALFQKKFVELKLFIPLCLRS
jgi:hypothetical protein